jgi:hypothetical protein
MAEQIISPGAFARENDNSFITQGPLEAGAALITPAVKGPVEIPTLITSYPQYESVYGSTIQSGSSFYSYLGNITARNYFNQGGKSLLVARVVSGSAGTWTPATSTNISGSNTAVPTSFTLETLSKGIIMNSSGSEVSGALASGSADNVRWEVSSVNANAGTFNLLVRRGDDNTKSKTILETWTNLSLDPNSSNYISYVIGDQVNTLVTSDTTYYVATSGSYPNQSRYVRVSAVNAATPNYFDNNGLPKSQYTASLPVVSSGSFTGATGNNISSGRVMNFYENISATDSQGVTGSNYNNVISLLGNKDEYVFNVITAPGLTFVNAPQQVSNLITLCETRGDAFYITDLVNFGSTVSNVSSQAFSLDSSYAGAYWPWLQTIDPNLGKNAWIPASTMMLGVYAFNDKISAPWFAPAGINRGGISGVVQAERKVPQTDRDTLYTNKVNPLATFPGQGVVAYGQKTLQTKASALDRINVRRLLIEIKGYINSVSRTIVFEQNVLTTRNKFLSIVNPYLTSVQQRSGLYAFKVVMDDSNNTSDVIDRNQLVGQIYIQPSKTAEFVIVDFDIQPTGTTL